MVNSTNLYGNKTQTSFSSDKFALIVNLTFFMVIILCFFIFIYYIAIILKVYFTTAHVQESSRYLLFIHMIINDTIYLTIGIVLFATGIFLIFIPAHFCYILITLSTVTFRVTPYNLAAMSLERYLAVCFPLRHPHFCNVKRTTAAITVIWLVGLIPNIADFIALNSMVGKGFYSLHMLCSRVTVTMSPEQSTIRLYSIIISFSMVGLIIMFTYFKVILVARKMGSSKSSAMKAGKTIMLHAFQLLLCMTSFTSSITETYFKRYMQFLGVINFLFFMCLPRFLSPLVYGIRDNIFRKHIKNVCSTKL